MELRIVTIIVAACFAVGGVLAFAVADAPQKGEKPYSKIDAFCRDLGAKTARPFVRVYFFTSDYCAPCKAVEPVVLKMKTDKRSEIVIVRKETNAGERFRKRFGVEATPTFVCVRVDRETGAETVFDMWSGGKNAKKKIDFAFRKGVKNE